MLNAPRDSSGIMLVVGLVAVLVMTDSSVFYVFSPARPFTFLFFILKFLEILINKNTPPLTRSLTGDLIVNYELITSTALIVFFPQLVLFFPLREGGCVCLF
jgi:hypothetical protein